MNVNKQKIKLESKFFYLSSKMNIVFTPMEMT